MGRSPYAPPPSYAICKYCHGNYDNSGYYGTDDESHFCREKARNKIRLLLRFFPDLISMISEVKAEVAEEQNKRERAEKENKILRLKGTIADSEENLSILKAELKELEK